MNNPFELKVEKARKQLSAGFKFSVALLSVLTWSTNKEEERHTSV